MNIPDQYVPNYLSEKDKIKARKNIMESRENYKKGIFTPRIKLKSAITKKSNWTTKFKSKYGDLNKDEIIKLLEDKGALNAAEAIDQILKKGKGAYYSGGSRPIQTPFSWALARLYSVLLGGKSREVDINIVNKYNLPLL
jgi:hypothetical protein